MREILLNAGETFHSNNGHLYSGMIGGLSIGLWTLKVEDSLPKATWMIDERYESIIPVPIGYCYPRGMEICSFHRDMNESISLLNELVKKWKDKFTSKRIDDIWFLYWGEKEITIPDRDGFYTYTNGVFVGINE